MGFFDDLSKGIRDSLRGDINDLLKGDADSLQQIPQPVQPVEGSIGTKAILDDPYFDNTNQSYLYKTKLSRITHKTLKEVSLRDWVTSAIIQARCDTMLRFARPQRKNLDMGYKIFKKDRQSPITAEDRKLMEDLEDYIYNCGRKQGTPVNEEMLFGEFLKLVTRDALTFGHVGVEKVFSRNKALHRFRPLPSETLYLVNKNTPKEVIDKELKNARKTFQMKIDTAGSNNPDSEKEYNLQDNDYYKYMQLSVDNRILAAFGDEDLIWKLFNPQNFADSMGYCYSPLELAIVNITNHLNIENYNANFFTHGYAARGILHLKGTTTQAQLTAFRRQFYNTITGTQNAWRTPIIAGLDDVQWVPMSGSAKEMEYLNYNNHVMRAICSQFQIDPLELGLDYLISGTGRGQSQQANNEYKINYSRERGLIPILMMFEDMINGHIFPAIDKELAAKYEFKFTGYDDESPQTFIANLQAEMTVYSTMNDLLRAAGKEAIKHAVGDLPLNQSFWELVEKNMTRGEIRATFFKDEAALKKRELAYLPSDPTFMAWQQLLLTVDTQRQQMMMQKQQMDQAAQQQAAEAQAQQEQSQRDQEMHDATLDQHNASMDEYAQRQAHDVVDSQYAQGLHDNAKKYGMATSGLHIDGQTVPNPINQIVKDK